ncbi:hypothetical protein BJX63DRAFT_177200 [Aspergillus granulosus]|uniref:Uncharacterized protein n=1 Tax=Aspergillus granulosus TaxID=176169 RepID=A0ABR4I2K1_9EURO
MVARLDAGCRYAFKTCRCLAVDDIVYILGLIAPTEARLFVSASKRRINTISLLRPREPQKIGEEAFVWTSDDPFAMICGNSSLSRRSRLAIALSHGKSPVRKEKRLIQSKNFTSLSFVFCLSNESNLLLLFWFILWWTFRASCTAGLAGLAFVNPLVPTTHNSEGIT